VLSKIVALQAGDSAHVMAASHLFDGLPKASSTERFLHREGHHILIAYVDGEPVGFVTGIEVEHPDKGFEMLLYELGVDAAFRGQGVGRALVDRLAALAKELGCYGMWTVTDGDNATARAVYEGSGAESEIDQIVEVWTFR
jgi:GNAT superfamily N-acetyltransferase